MKSLLTRRRFIGSLSGGALALAAGAPCLQAREAGPRLTATHLADNLLWIQGAGANVVVARDAQGLVFIDGGLATHAQALLDLAKRELGAQDAHTLINTHWHPEQTGLNVLLGRNGAKIIAHENTRLWLSTTVRHEPDGPPIGPLPEAARPNATTYRTGELVVGDETVRYGYLPQAHTDGDLYVYFPGADVLVTGGVVAGNGWPTADWVTGGWINGTVAGYQQLLGLTTPGTRVVSANGEHLLTREELEEQHQALQKLATELGRMMRAGYGPADVLAENPAKDYVAKLGDASEFLVESFRSMWPRMAPDA